MINCIYFAVLWVHQGDNNNHYLLLTNFILVSSLRYPYEASVRQNSPTFPYIIFEVSWQTRKVNSRSLSVTVIYETYMPRLLKDILPGFHEFLVKFLTNSLKAFSWFFKTGNFLIQIIQSSFQRYFFDDKLADSG